MLLLLLLWLLHFFSRSSFVSWASSRLLHGLAHCFVWLLNYACELGRSRIPHSVFSYVSLISYWQRFFSLSRFSLLKKPSALCTSTFNTCVAQILCVSVVRNTWSAHMISLFIYLFIWCSFDDVQKFILNSLHFLSVSFSFSVCCCFSGMEEKRKKKLKTNKPIQCEPKRALCGAVLQSECSGIGGKLWMKLICIGYIGLFFAAWLLWSCGCTQHFSALQRFLFDCFLFWSYSCLHDAHLRNSIFFPVPFFHWIDIFFHLTIFPLSLSSSSSPSSSSSSSFALIFYYFGRIYYAHNIRFLSLIWLTQCSKALKTMNKKT